MSKALLNNHVNYQFHSSKYYMYLFLVWPFLAFLSALFNFEDKNARRTTYLFLIYHGLTLYIATEGIDAAAYAIHLRKNSLLPFSDFFKIVGGLYASDTSVDIIEPFLSFVVSRFTSDYNVLFAVFATIFGFFYLKSISLLYDRYKSNQQWDALIHMLFFAFIIPITYINGFRMWTAAWIFFYGAYHVILYRDGRYLLVALSSSLVHWSFISANLILVIYFFAGNRNAVFLPIAMLSFVLPKLLSSTFQRISLSMGGALQSRYESYSSESYVLFRQEDVAQASWFLRIGNDLVFYYLLLAIIVVQLKLRNCIRDKADKNLFSFLLLFLAFVNFGKEIPSFGSRFQIVFFLFATLYIFRYFVKQQEKGVNIVTWIGLFPMLLYTAVALRQGSETINAWILSPVVGLPLLVPGMTLYQLLFG